MKKVLLTTAIAVTSLAANAQDAVSDGKFFDNWSLGIQAGMYEPTVGQNMLKDMRPGINIELAKQISPAFGLSATAFTGINANNNNDRATRFLHYTPAAKSAFDFINLGVNGLFNLNGLCSGEIQHRRMHKAEMLSGFAGGFAERLTGDDLRVRCRHLRADCIDFQPVHPW